MGRRRMSILALTLLAAGATGAMPLHCEPTPVEPEACDQERIGLTQENPERYEYYLLCIPQAGVDPSFELQEIDPSIHCGTALHPACRDTSDASCMGELAFDDSARTIGADKWSQLCELSMLPWVERIVGGYWLY